MKKYMTKSIICFTIIFSLYVNTHILNVTALAQYGIKGNGTSGIYIDINSAPYTTYANKSYGEYAYGTQGCAWFASARAYQLTGKGQEIYSGTNWYYTAYSYFGFSRGNTPKVKALACYNNHVAVVEAINGDVITVSEGGMGGLSSSEYGYCVISTMTKSKLESDRGTGSFIGYVYLGETSSGGASSDYVFSTPCNPIGCLDSISGGAGTVSLSGWALDGDSKTESLNIHVYIGGAYNDTAVHGDSSIIADAYRSDVNNAYPGVGNYHGFADTISVPVTGTYTVYVYAINVGGSATSSNYNTCLGSGTVTITNPDTAGPTIANVNVDADTKGYTITADVVDAAGVDRVQFPTWTPWNNGQDDLADGWQTSAFAKGTYANGKVTYRVNRSDHNNELGTYVTDIYAYDVNGNVSTSRTSYTFEQNKPEISDVQVSVDETGYTVTCTVEDESGLDKVVFPTWTAKSGQDDLVVDWWVNEKCFGTINGSTVTYHVNFADHNNEEGFYITHIYAYDKLGNRKSYHTGATIGTGYEQLDSITYNGHTYYLFDNPEYTAWSNLKSYCNTMGGYLATITSAEENAAVLKLFENKEVQKAYLGATDRETEGTWHWVTEEKWEYTNWDDGQPNDVDVSEFEDGQDYLVIRSNGKWEDFEDDSSGYGYIAAFICEVDGPITYNITYHLDGGINNGTNPDTYTSDDATLTILNPTKAHYEFKGWYLSETGTDKFVSGEKYEGNLDLYARWEPEKYVITYDVNGGDDMGFDSVETEYSEDLLVLLPKPEREGYKFLGWSESKEGGKIIAQLSAVDRDYTLYAQWSANEYSITYDAADGNVLSEGKTVLYDQKYGTLPIPIREGYVFEGWFTAIDGGVQITEDSLMKTAQDHILYAHWSPREYDLIYNPNGGTLSGTNVQSAVYDEAYGNLLTPEKKGYEFEGWYTLPEGGIQITADTLCKGDRTVYAQWSAQQYIVTLDVNGGGALKNSKINVTFDSAYGEIEDPAREGYTFNGWYTAKNGGTKIEEDTIVAIADNHTLYARWQGKACTIVYNANGGIISGSITKNVTYGSAYGTLASCTRDGYTFLGWFTTPDGTNQITADSICKGDITLYAQWEKVAGDDNEDSDNYEDSETEDHVHKYILIRTVAATCKEKGMKIYSCDCGSTRIDEISNANIAHVYKWITDKAATTTASGVKHEECSICGHKRNEFTIIDKLPVPAGTALTDSSKKVTYKVTDEGTVEYTKTKSTSSKVSVPATVTIGGNTYKVTSIAANAFKNNKKITKVTIGSNITTIGANAFSGCKKLKTLTIGKNVTSIGSKAFYKCTALTKVTIPSKVTTIGTAAFSGCSKLKTLSLGKKVETIGNQAFYKCTKLTKVTIPASVTKIGKQAFYGCKKLKSITIKTTKLTTKTVGSQAFKSIYSKATIKVPKSKLSAYKKLLKSKGVSKKAKIKK